MSDRLAEALARLPELLAAHVLLALAALAAGAAISLPAGIAASRDARIAGPVTALASGVQTIPSLALLALMVPLFGGRIGYAPAFTALTLYSVLPILRNTIVGVAGVDRDVIEAARAVGMTPRQRLLRVELPLAAPVILAGLRTSAIWVVGAATLSTPVGASSLGDFIFGGLQTRNWTLVLVGCVAAAVLALALDQALRLGERAARLRRHGAALAAALALAPFPVIAAWPALAALAPAGEAGAARSVAGAGEAPLATLDGARIVVGAKGFTEQMILAELLRLRLEEAGADVDVRANLGSSIVFDAVASGEVDVYVDYTGTLWANVLGEDRPIPRARMFARVAGALAREHGVIVLGRLGFENAYAFAMSRARAEALGARSIADLAAAPERLSLGADPEFFERPEWTRVREAYGLDGMQQRAMDSAFMYAAARDGQVDAITAYTTDGRIDAFDLALLSDPRAALPPYDAVILLSERASGMPGVTGALRPLLNAIPAALMRAANGKVDLEGETPAQAAAWLDAELRGRGGQAREPAACPRRAGGARCRPGRAE